MTKYGQVKGGGQQTSRYLSFRDHLFREVMKEIKRDYVKRDKSKTFAGVRGRVSSVNKFYQQMEGQEESGTEVTRNIQRLIFN